MEISIVIPVRDNQRGVDNYLDEFFKTHPAEYFPKEIIVVDNNSSPAITLKDRHLLHALPIKLIVCNKEGPAAARNFGVLNAQGEWILFNDSDCLPTRSLLTGYLNADNGSFAYAGNIKSLRKDWLSKYYDSQEILLPLKTINYAGESVPQYLITANSLVWKRAFIGIGGFNEEIKIAGGEDIDLGLRLSVEGHLAYAFDSIALHDFNDGLIGFFRRFRRYGRGNRLIEEIWRTNMTPHLFLPNKKTVSNVLMALLQYLFLLGGYIAADREIRRDSARKSK
ncbi:MAG: glycosyltransferase [Taibaiella sp.]|nr:glycosyltransferase [Taibaiella sp.]